MRWNSIKKNSQQFFHILLIGVKLKRMWKKQFYAKFCIFSDFDYYEEYEVPITNETYIKYGRGPYPNHIDEVIGEMIEEGILEVKNEPYFDSTIPKHYLKVVPDVSLLSTEELNVIDTVVDNLADMSANDIGEYSQGDMPWMVAEDNCDLDYEYVFYRDSKYSVRDYNN